MTSNSARSGPRFEFFVGHLDHRHAAEPVRHRRIERVDAQRPIQRCARIADRRYHARLQRHAIADLERRDRLGLGSGWWWLILLRGLAFGHFRIDGNRQAKTARV
jgi:hypothetical protein